MTDDAFHTLRGTLDQTWKILEKGVENATAPARYVSFATMGLDGYPQARTLVLRGANRDLAVVEIYTDAATTKIAELEKTPKAAVLAWDREALFQIRLSVDVEIAEGPPEVWAQFPEPAMQNYGGLPTPGTPMKSAQDYIAGADKSRFATLSCSIQSIDTVYLGPDLHRRAAFSRADGFKGTWVAP